MERLQGFQGYVRFPGAVHIEDLSADHTGGTGGGETDARASSTPPGGKILHGGGHKPEGVGQQGVARKDGGGFIEGLVAGGAATAQIVIIHRGQIVVDEGVRVDHFSEAAKGITARRARPNRAAVDRHSTGRRRLPPARRL